MKLLALLLLFPVFVHAQDIDLHVHESDPTAQRIIKAQEIAISVKDADCPPVKPCDNMAWTPLEKWMAGITTALILIDMSQTFSFTSRGIAEKNPLLPDHPTKWQLRGALVGSLTLYWGGTYLLPRPYRTMWQTGYVLGEGYAVYSNHFLIPGGSGYAIPW